MNSKEINADNIQCADLKSVLLKKCNDERLAHNRAEIPIVVLSLRLIDTKKNNKKMISL
jgi:hypothetical protein